MCSTMAGRHAAAANSSASSRATTSIAVLVPLKNRTMASMAFLFFPPPRPDCKLFLRVVASSTGAAASAADPRLQRKPVNVNLIDVDEDRLHPRVRASRKSQQVFEVNGMMVVIKEWRDIWARSRSATLERGAEPP